MIRIYHSGGVTELKWSGAPEKISEILIKNGVYLDSPCSGHGKCGKCRVTVSGCVSAPSDSERTHLTDGELSSGIRLACLAMITGDTADIRVPLRPDIEAVTDGIGEAAPIDPLGRRLGLAVDIGTTTVAAYLYDLSAGARLGAASSKNPQSTFGADVVSRHEHALKGGGDALSRVIRDCIGGLAKRLTDSCGRSVSDIDAAVITGNTTMLYLLCGYDVRDIAVAPFEASHLFGMSVPAGKLFPGFAHNCAVYLPPCISAYVGADITCAILSSGITESSGDKLLADIGTNGELALYSGGRLFCCSTAAGPAFEGAGIELGSGAVSGAIDRVWAEGRSVMIRTIADSPAVSICGSGLLDAVSVLLSLGMLDETGRLHVDGGRVYLGGSQVYITQEDVRNVQLAKAAIRAGIETLLSRAALPPDDIPRLYIAGGFGSRLCPCSAAAIGMIPGSMAERCLAIGNAAGLGAAKLLLDRSNIEKCRDIVEMATSIELSGDAGFSDSFMENIAF